MENVDNKQETTPVTQEQNTPAMEEVYNKLVQGEVSLDAVSMETGQISSESANPNPAQKETGTTEEPKTTEVVTETETLETYKAKAEKERERLEKIAKDNQAEFTRRSQELAVKEAEIKALKEELSQFKHDQEKETELDMSKFEDYPDEIKDTIKALNNANKAYRQKLNDIDQYVNEEKSRRSSEEQKRQEALRIQQEFRDVVLPQIKKEIPDYDVFIQQNFPAYRQWALTLSKGQQFAFLQSNDPRDLIAGYKEYKKFANLPYEKEAIKQTNIEQQKTQELYSNSVPASKKTVAPKAQPPVDEQSAYEREIARQAEEYNKLYRR